MKQLHCKTKTLLTSCLLVASQGAFADAVTLAHSFSAGEKARAADVNANFSALETAVNANYTELENVVAGVQDKFDDVDDNITSLNDNIDGFNNTVISVSALSMQATADGRTDTGCKAVYRPLGYVYFDSSYNNVSSCLLFAPLSLPHGSSISSVTCYGYDSASDGIGVQTRLFKREVTGTSREVIAIGGTTTNANIQSYEVEMENAAAEVVDNSEYQYYLQSDWGALAAGEVSAGVVSKIGDYGQNVRLYGCSISLTR